jgi:hypothetical protein
VASSALALGLIALARPGQDRNDGGGAGADLDLSWHSIGGGGGTSTAGSFELLSTIGQPDASPPMTAGNFALAGGFAPGAVPIDSCPADITGNQLVNVDDLLAVINAWGGVRQSQQLPSRYCPAAQRRR